MKKLIALLLLAGFLMVTLTGCPSQTTGGGVKPVSTGGASTAK